jgi:glycosyltransferase involved in cell wall biosynthesis
MARTRFYLRGKPMNALRLLVVIVNLVPYHVARWTAVAEAGHQVTVLQRRAGDPFAVLATDAEQAPFQLHTLADPLVGGVSWQRQLVAWIDRLNPQVLVISGYSFPESLAALLVAADRGLPVVVCSESNSHDAPRRPWTEFFKRRVLSLAQAGLVGGEPQASYLQQLGVPPEAIFRGYNAVDNDHFATAHHWRFQGEQARNQFGLPPRYLLAVTRFTEKKNLHRLIEGYALWRRHASLEQQQLSLVILGDGPLRAQLEDQVAALGLQHSVQLPGPCSYSELPIRYGLAEAFIHASTVEQWGLVVNEAMAAGLPVLASSTCGCAPELVQPGVTGLRFDPYTSASIAAAIRWWCELPDAAVKRLAAACPPRVASYGPASFAAGMEAAATYALSAHRRPLNPIDRHLLQLLIARSSSKT